MNVIIIVNFSYPKRNKNNNYFNVTNYLFGKNIVNLDIYQFYEFDCFFNTELLTW